MTDRLDTDKQRTIVVAGCPNGCQQWELETTGDPDAVDQLVDRVNAEFGECRTCGASMGSLRKDDQQEVLD